MPRTTDDRTTGDVPTAASMNKINADLDQLNQKGSDRLRVFAAASGTALRVDIGEGNYYIGTVLGLYAGATDIVVTDTATNYIMIDSSGSIQQSTSGWNNDYARLATVLCSSGVITDITLYKVDTVGGKLGKELSRSEITATTHDIISGQGYLANNSDEIVFTLPATAAAGEKTSVKGTGNGGRKIGQLAGQSIVKGRYTSTVGTGGFIRSSGSNDLIELVCIEADTKREVLTHSGAPFFDSYVSIGSDIYDPLFGDGSDGDITIASGTTTLVADMQYGNLTIASGAVLDTNGFKVYVRGKLTNGGTIRRNGNNASGTTAGATLNQGTLNAERLGGDGGASGGTTEVPGDDGEDSNPSRTNIDGVNGGAGGVVNGTAGGAAGAGGTTTRGAYYNRTRTIQSLIQSMRCVTQDIGDLNTYLTETTPYLSIPGSGGGGEGATYSNDYSGGDGGAAGGNGGLIFMATKEFIGSGGTIEATGGNGSAGDNGNNGNSGDRSGGGGGGGGGGNGGVCVLVCQDYTAGSIDFGGGTGGAAGSGGTGGAGPGGDGSVGVAGASGELIQITV